MKSILYLGATCVSSTTLVLKCRATEPDVLEDAVHGGVVAPVGLLVAPQDGALRASAEGLAPAPLVVHVGAPHDLATEVEPALLCHLFRRQATMSMTYRGGRKVSPAVAVENFSLFARCDQVTDHLCDMRNFYKENKKKPRDRPNGHPGPCNSVDEWEKTTDV